jgi:hypothetical protein
VINLHPLDNAKTVTIARDDLLRFLDDIAHPARVLDFG